MTQLKFRVFGNSTLTSVFALVLAGGLSAAGCGGGEDTTGGDGDSDADADKGDGDGDGDGDTPGDGDGDAPQTVWETTTCDARTSKDATKVSGAVDADATWSGVVYLEDAVSIAGATVTIEKGTQIVAAAGSSLSVSAGGSLVAQGDENEPVRFCGEEDGAGSWGGVTLAADASDTSELSYTLIADAGSAEQAVLVDVAALFNNVRVENSGSDGVHAAAFKTGSAGLTVTGAVGAPVVLTDAAAVTPFPVGGDLTGNGDDTVHLRAIGDAVNDDILIDVTFAALDVPYLAETSIDVQGGDLAIEAGTHLLMAEDTFIAVALFGTGGSMRITGTAEEPVIIEGDGEDPDRIHWNGLRDEPSADPPTHIEHLVMRHGTDLEIYSAATLIDVHLDTCADGLRILGEPLNPESKNVTVENGGNSLEVAPSALCSIPLGGSYSGNEEDYVRVIGGDFTDSCALPDVGLAYGWYDPTSIQGALTVPLGSELRIFADGLLTVEAGGRLLVEGTAEQRIRFFYGGGAFPPESTGLRVLPTASDETSISGLDFSGPELDLPVCIELHRPIAVRDSIFEGPADCFRVNTGEVAPGVVYTEVDYDNGMEDSLLSGNNRSPSEF